MCTINHFLEAGPKSWGRTRYVLGENFSGWRCVEALVCTINNFLEAGPQSWTLRTGGKFLGKRCDELLCSISHFFVSWAKFVNTTGVKVVCINQPLYPSKLGPVINATGGKFLGKRCVEELVRAINHSWEAGPSRKIYWWFWYGMIRVCAVDRGWRGWARAQSTTPSYSAFVFCFCAPRVNDRYLRRQMMATNGETGMGQDKQKVFL